MRLLLEFYALRRKSLKALDYKEFKQLLSSSKNDYQAKQIFKDLRDLQKSFEDLFPTPQIYNYLKMSLLCNTGREDIDGHSTLFYFPTQKLFYIHILLIHSLLFLLYLYISNKLVTKYTKTSRICISYIGRHSTQLKILSVGTKLLISYE